MDPSRFFRALFLVACILAVCTWHSASRVGAQGPPHPTVLLVVRHGQAYSNLTPPPSLPQEQLDALTPQGGTEAAAAGVRAQRYPVAAVVTSPTGRTRQTAAIIAQAVGLPEGPAADAAFASVKMGTLPDGQPTTWDWRFAEWQAGHDPRPAGGESLEDAAARTIHAVQLLVTKHAGKTVVIVTHSDIVAALIGHAAGTPIAQRYATHPVSTGAVSEITVSPDGVWTLGR